jgi:hypothetical protein
VGEVTLSCEMCLSHRQMLDDARRYETEIWHLIKLSINILVTY